MRKEFRVHRHQVFKMTVLRAIFDHPDLTVAFDDLCFDLTDLFIDQRRNVTFTADDLFPRLDNAVWAERIGLPRKPKRRLGFLPRLEYRFVRPFGNERRIWLELIDRLNSFECAGGDIGQPFFEMFYWSHNK